MRELCIENSWTFYIGVLNIIPIINKFSFHDYKWYELKSNGEKTWSKISHNRIKFRDIFLTCFLLFNYNKEKFFFFEIQFMDQHSRIFQNSGVLVNLIILIRKCQIENFSISSDVILLFWYKTWLNSKIYLVIVKLIEKNLTFCVIIFVE